MKTILKALIFSFVTLASSSYLTAEPYDYLQGEFEFTSDESEIIQSALALQTSARAWLAFLQDLPVMPGKQDLYDDSIRYARVFQLSAIETAELVDQKSYDLALEKLDQMSQNFASISRSYRSLVREYREDIRTRRELQDRFSRIRTTYYYLGNLLSTGSGY